MAKTNKVLSIDITNESITIIELTVSQKKQTDIHYKRCRQNGSGYQGATFQQGYFQ